MKLLLVFLLASTSAFALDNKAIGGGFNYATTSYNAGVDADFENKNPIGFNLGMLGFYRTAKGQKIRTGIMLVNKKAEAEESNVDFKLKATYISVPLTMVRNMKKGFDLFYGLNPALKIDDDCDNESNTNDKCDGDTATLVHPFTIGIRKNLDGKLNLEVSYEHALKDSHTGVRMNGLMFNVFYDL